MYKTSLLHITRLISRMNKETGVPKGHGNKSTGKIKLAGLYRTDHFKWQVFYMHS